MQRLLLLRCISVLVCAAAVAGCRGRQVYEASKLPAELMARRVRSANRIDLSRISRSVGNSEILYAGDLVRVTITTGVEDEVPKGWPVRIAENGVCGIPLVGPVQVAGLSIPQAEQVIRQESIRRQKFVSPVVSLVREEPRSNRVTVVGAVTKPGTYEIPASQSDLLEALTAAEGITEDAGTIIEIRHPAQPPSIAGPGGQPIQVASFPGPPAGVGVGPQVVRVDLEQVMEQPGGDFRIYDGSKVMVMQKPQRYIHVIGLVNQANQFELPDDTDVTLLDAIAMAGGLKLELADKIRIMRRVPETDDIAVIEASYREAKLGGGSNLRLAAGDVVSVEETPTTFVVGTIREFVRFGFTSGIPGI